MLTGIDIEQLDPFFRYAHRNITDSIDVMISNELDNYVTKDMITSSENVSASGYYISDANSIYKIKLSIDQWVEEFKTNLSTLQDLINTTSLSLNGQAYGSDPLPYGVDLNSYMYIHQCTVPYSSVPNIENSPTHMGFRFFVLNLGTPVQSIEDRLERCIQVVIELSDNSFIYVRGYYGVQWTDWVTIKNSNNILVGNGAPAVGKPGDLYFRLDSETSGASIIEDNNESVIETENQ